MKLIKELITETRSEKSEDGKTLFLDGIIMQGNIFNKNGRKYPTEYLTEATSKYIKEFVDTGRAYGELGHPDNASINPERVSHRFTEVQAEGDNFMGRAKVSKGTPYGQIVYGLHEDGGKFCMSSRGLGSIIESDEGDIVDQDYTIVTGGDIVIDPSAPDAFVEGIMECRDWTNALNKTPFTEEDIEKTQKVIADAPMRKLDEAKFYAALNFIRKIKG